MYEVSLHYVTFIPRHTGSSQKSHWTSSVGSTVLRCTYTVDGCRATETSSSKHCGSRNDCAAPVADFRGPAQKDILITSK
ncbi:predicted protein [Botrytis cinerea T4]|uniref:Uncharacterized protein n=1 Tax=Botryotinia fuckeliana (strain T4) TaxID=999810 RepID=G2XW59_BOTF4|nr:predicted protein [Botrytis cinerea T4]